MLSFISHFRRIGCTFGCLMCLFPITAVSAADQAVRSAPVRVGWYENAYNITGEHGERRGYGYEFQQAVAGYTSWNYDYVRANWTELLEMMREGKIDLMGAVSYTEDRSREMLFSELPMGSEKYYLYADLAHTDISAADLSTLNGKRVGIRKGSVEKTLFFQWAKAHNLNLEYIPLMSDEEAKTRVANRELDCVVSPETPAWVEAGMSAIATTGASNVYFVINKRRPDLKVVLDGAMRKMEYDHPFYADELYQRYMSARRVAVLSDGEKTWLAEHGPVRIGWTDHDSGFSRVDPDTGEMTGVVNDYVRLAEEALGSSGLRFELVQIPSYRELLAALKERRIDMIFHMPLNPYAAETNNFTLSNAVLNQPLAAVTAKKTINENDENTVAVERDNLLYKWYVSYNYPKWKVQEFSSFEAVEEAVREGKADCFLARVGQLTKYIEDNRLHSVFLMASGTSVFAVNRNESTLLSILNKTLRSVSPATLTGAMSAYDNTLRKVTVKDFLKSNLWEVVGGSVTGFLLILYVMLRLLRNARRSEAKARQAVAQTKVLNRKLAEAARVAKKANEAKTEFLFNMSHDIRTPMNAVLGYAKMIREGLRDPKLIGYQEKMEQSGQLLLSILNNVLDMARIESGKMEVNENYCRVGDIVAELTEVFEMEARRKGLKLVRDNQVEHQHVMCDVTKVKEIFTNLLSNAMKFTPRGGTVTITSRELPLQEPGFVMVETTVSDTGIGIGREYLPALFEPFTRERNTTIGKVPGTGLGMTIVKKLVDMLGGTIRVESEPGKGSRFTVTLKHRIADEIYYRKPSVSCAAVTHTDVRAGKRILLAEDNQLNAEIAIYILEKLGMTVDLVEDGVQCVSRMEAMPAGTYDLILMDIQMPHMDGYKATQAIRQFDDAVKAAIPIVAMTANAFENDRQNAFKAGMNGHIAKPIDAAKVRETLTDLLG